MGLGGTERVDRPDAGSPGNRGQRSVHIYGGEAAGGTTTDGATHSSPNMGTSVYTMLVWRRASPFNGKSLTGEPDAGNPPVRFGGRGGVLISFPTPIIQEHLDALVSPHCRARPCVEPSSSTASRKVRP